MTVRSGAAIGFALMLWLLHRERAGLRRENTRVLRSRGVSFRQLLT
jgi:hypothetical protein